jgi:hypothetical protein
MRARRTPPYFPSVDIGPTPVSRLARFALVRLPATAGRMGSAALPVFALGAACTSIPTVRWSRLGVRFFKPPDRRAFF